MSVQDYPIHDRGQIGERIQRSVTEAASAGDLIRATMDLVREIIPADRGTMFAMDSKSMTLRSEFAQGMSQGLVVPLRIGILGTAILQRKVVSVDDAYAHPFFNPEIDLSLRFQTRSVIVAPMVASTGRLLGGIELINKRNGLFDASDEAAMIAAAQRIGRWIEDGTAYPAGVEAESIAMRNSLDCERASVFSLEVRTSKLVALYADGDDGRVLTLNMRLGIAGLVAILGYSVMLDDAWADTRFDRSVDTRTGYRTKSMLCVPVCSGDGLTLGVIQLINSVTGEFSPDQQMVLEYIGGRLADGLRNHNGAGA